MGFLTLILTSGDCADWEGVARADDEEAGRLLEAELEPQLEWCRLLLL